MLQGLIFGPKPDLRALGRTPINVPKLQELLLEYPKKSDATFLLNGFQSGFKLNFEGPRLPIDCNNLKSIKDTRNSQRKNLNEVKLGRIAGPFTTKPISYMSCFLIWLVAKKTGGYRLITHLSHPPGLSVNEHIDDAFASVKYSNVDSAVTMMKTFGTGCLISTVDIKSAFRLLPCYPGDFDLFGFKFQNEYFIDKMAPMGLRISCCAWEKIATFLNWLLMERFGSKNVDHYLDDFFFAGSPLCSDCANLMSQFDDLCE